MECDIDSDKPLEVRWNGVKRDNRWLRSKLCWLVLVFVIWGNRVCVPCVSIFRYLKKSVLSFHSRFRQQSYLVRFRKMVVWVKLITLKQHKS